jgi:hypothetical protein
MLDVNTVNNKSWDKSFKWLGDDNQVNLEWLGDGTTSNKIIQILKNIL